MWLLFTGISIGCVTRYSPPTLVVISSSCTGFVHSVKLVGLFVTALVGVYTVEDLWHKFGDLKMSLVSSFRIQLHQFSGLNGNRGTNFGTGGPVSLVSSSLRLSSI